MPATTMPAHTLSARTLATFSCAAARTHASRVLALMALLGAHVHAAPPVKPGLWEITTDSQQLNGQALPDVSAQMAEQMKRMPPQVRAQMEAQMKAHGVQMGPGASGKGMVVRTCVTQDMLNQNLWQKHEGRCQNTELKQSGATWTWKFACTEPSSEGEGSTTFTSSEAYTSDLRVTTQRKGQAQTMTMKHHAKWVSADCGGLPPAIGAAKR